MICFSLSACYVYFTLPHHHYHHHVYVYVYVCVYAHLCTVRSRCNRPVPTSDDRFPNTVIRPSHLGSGSGDGSDDGFRSLNHSGKTHYSLPMLKTR